MVKESDWTICGHGSGKPSKKNLAEYNEKRYNSIAKNGVHKGVVAVRRIKGGMDKKHYSLFRKAYDLIMGRNIYSQDLREYCFKKYSGKFYSDCSSSGMSCYEQIGYAVGMLNTVGILTSDKFETVPVKIKDGHITNPEVLHTGDCILYAGEDASRKLQVGHVEYIYKKKQV